MSHGRGISPDVLLEVRLNGAATCLAHEDAPLREAVAQLEAMAGGRADLLAGAAGSILGSYLARPGSTHPQMVHAVALSSALALMSSASSSKSTERVRTPMLGTGEGDSAPDRSRLVAIAAAFLNAATFVPDDVVNLALASHFATSRDCG